MVKQERLPKQPLVSGFHKTELPLNDAEWVLHFGPDAGLHIFDVDGDLVLAPGRDRTLLMKFEQADRL